MQVLDVRGRAPEHGGWDQAPAVRRIEGGPDPGQALPEHRGAGDVGMTPSEHAQALDEIARIDSMIEQTDSLLNRVEAERELSFDPMEMTDAQLGLDFHPDTDEKWREIARQLRRAVLFRHVPNVTSHPVLRSMTDWTEGGATYRQLAVLLLISGVGGMLLTVALFWAGAFG